MSDIQAVGTECQEVECGDGAPQQLVSPGVEPLSHELSGRAVGVPVFSVYHA